MLVVKKSVKQFRYLAVVVKRFNNNWCFKKKKKKVDVEGNRRENKI